MLSLDKFQQLRIRRLSMAVATYSIVILYAYLIEWAGKGALNREEVWMMIISAVAGNAFFAFMIVSGINLSLPDPSMTRIQIIFSAAWGLIAILALPEARLLVLFLYIPAFLFGALILKRHAYIGLALIISGLLGGAQWYEFHYLRPDMNVAYEVLIWACFSLILLWTALFGSYLAKARFQLRKQNIELQDAKGKLMDLTIDLREAAHTDPLTRTLNRRAFYDQVQIWHKNQGEHPAEHALLLIDIDHFKRLNDEYGHAVGDEVLVIIAQRIENQLRPDDLLVRWGGEEFLVLLRNTATDQALQAAERIRHACSQPLRLNQRADLQSSVSIGCASGNDLLTMDQTIKQADSALYAAKEAGRNKVVCHTDCIAPTPSTSAS